MREVDLSSDEKEYLEVQIVHSKKDEFSIHDLFEWIERCNQENYFVVPRCNGFQRWLYDEYSS